MMAADAIAEKLTMEVMGDLPFKAGDEVALMINGLGGTPHIELYICYRKAKQILDTRGIKIGLSYVGEFFTGLEMAGFSVTVTKLDEELKKLLSAPADTPYYKI
jgi:dihydroxyacetone kinase-like protein